MSDTGTPELIYLADLTHTGQIVASNVAPLGIGLIASYLLQKHEGEVAIELFKYPEDLNRGLERHIPRVIGFSNYSWNLDLAYAFASRIKEISPETVLVFGGPNYGLSEEEIAAFWNRFPLIDFYIVREGEQAFDHLFGLLAANGFSSLRTKQHVARIPSCHYMHEGKLFKGELLPRIQDLSTIGSPYLRGLMDKFFDGVLIPMIHTTRGCPFTCTFCSEGSQYYSKVAQRTGLREELEYIAARRGAVQDIVITDANFGMYDEDRDKAEELSLIRQKYGWPNRVIVSTGKNKKEKIIEVAKILKGSMSIAASLQSTNAQVLRNINRSNISTEALSAVVNESEKVETTTYTEIILGLPGDSEETHTQSLRDVTTAGLGIVRMYQLILLPQTELNTPDTRKKYGISSRFRINPRSFGKYEVLGKCIVSIEHEEILVSSATLSFDAYLHCRELDLSVEMLHNSGMFMELNGLCSQLGLSWFDFLLRFYTHRRQHGPELIALYEGFRKDSQVGLWESQEQLEAHVKEHIDEYLGNTEGTNEMAKNKAIAFFKYLQPLHRALYSEMRQLLQEKGLLDAVLDDYLSELQQFSICRKQDFIDFERRYTACLHFDFSALEKGGFKVDPRQHQLAEGRTFEFVHLESQIQMIRAYVGQYGGNTIDGLGRILMRAPAKRLFRAYQANASSANSPAAGTNNLNVYGGFSL